MNIYELYYNLSKEGMAPTPSHDIAIGNVMSQSNLQMPTRSFRNKLNTRPENENHFVQQAMKAGVTGKDLTNVRMENQGPIPGMKTFGR